MATAACPKCGASLPDGQHRPARCPTCREPLGRCRYCTSFDPRMLDCASIYRPTDQHISDPDEVRNCPYHRLRPAQEQRRGRLPFALLRTSTVTVLLVVALIYGATALVRRQARAGGSGAIRASVDAPETSAQEEGFDLRVILFNPAKKPARGVQVVVSGRSFPSLTCRSVDPPECWGESTPRTVTAVIGDLPPAEHFAVDFHFTSERVGRLWLTTHVTTATGSKAASFPIETEVMP